MLYNTTLTFREDCFTHLQTCSKDHQEYPRPQAGQKHQYSDKKKKEITQLYSAVHTAVKRFTWMEGFHILPTSKTQKNLNCIKLFFNLIGMESHDTFKSRISTEEVFPCWQCKIVYIKFIFGKKILDQSIHSQLSTNREPIKPKYLFKM